MAGSSIQLLPNSGEVTCLRFDRLTALSASKGQVGGVFCIIYFSKLGYE